jgi:NADH:ubiquinone oxidoreductase subunit H
MFLAAVGIIAVSGTFSLWGITEFQMQHGWFAFQYWGAGLVLAFIFFVAGVAETERVPFDIPEAEAELVMGPRTEFSGWRYALLMMVEYLHAFVNGLLAIYLFFGGYDPLPIARDNVFGWDVSGLESFRTNGLVQFIALTIKAYIVIYVLAWFRSALARLRIDQLLSLGWKYFLPVALAAVSVMIGLDLYVYT